MQNVYLAGGMRRNWRERVTGKCDGLNFLSPVDKENEYDMSLEEYGAWDLHFIRQVDIVFGYMERTNPSGIGMACELGYAHGIGKTVILVLEENNEHFEDRYLKFMEKVSDAVFHELTEGVRFLNTFGT